MHYTHIPHPFLDKLLIELAANNYTLTDFILSILTSQQPFSTNAQTNAFLNMRLWLDVISTIPIIDEEVRTWVHEAAKIIYSEDVCILTHPSHGFRFNAANAALEQIEEFSISNLENTMKVHSPRLHDLILHLLVSDTSLNHRRKDSKEWNEGVDDSEFGADEPDEPDAEYWTQVDAIGLEDLYEELNYIRDEDTNDDSNQTDPQAGRARKRRKIPVDKRLAVQRIRCFMIICVLLVTTNQRCNVLGAMFGFFFHSKNVPEKVIQVLHRFGISDSVRSILNAINSLSRKSTEKICRAGQTLLCSVAYDNFDFNSTTNAPTLERDKAFLHAISATLIPLAIGVKSEDLRCSAEVYAKTGFNLDQPSAKVHFTFLDVINTPSLGLPRFTHLGAPKVHRTARQQRQQWHILSILVHHGSFFSKFETSLGRPDPVWTLPVSKTQQIPLVAMPLNQSTIEGNMQALFEINWQCGIGSEVAEHTLRTPVVFDDFVRLTHGDLGTLEKLDSLLESRRLEKSPEDRLQYLIPVMGLFHVKMAIVDALWKTYIEPQATRLDSYSVFNFIGILRPKETGKFISKPGFRRMHDIVHQITFAAILDCWRATVQHFHPNVESLEDFANTNPRWEDLQKLGEYIVDNFVAGSTFSNLRHRDFTQRDKLFENSCLRNRDFLDYIELTHAINWGDVGRIEEVFIPLICLCQSTSKNKYATHMLRHLGRMKFVYPEGLRDIIRRNWLINPTGKPDGFRPVDWLVELNNLYTKVIYGGTSSNRTLQLMIKQSPLIDLFREVHRIVEEVMHITSRTVRHAPPDMRRTLNRLQKYMEEGKIHVFTPGRLNIKHEIPDQLRSSLDTLKKMSSNDIN